MIFAIDIQILWESYGIIFLLMLSSFILGYFLAVYFLKRNINSTQEVNKIKENISHTSDSIKDIETIFTEIKPKIIDIVKEAQQKTVAPSTNTLKTSITVPEKAKSTYVSYSKNKVELDATLLGLASPELPDDLTKIEGIGPYVEERLNNIGIFNYMQISKLKHNDIRLITELIDFFPGRIERDNWVGQADKLKLYRSKL